MLKKLAAFAFLYSVAISIPAAYAEAGENPWGDYGSANTGSDDGRYTYKTGSARAYAAGRGYDIEQPGGTGPAAWGEQGWGERTKSNGAIGGANDYGPRLRGASSDASGIPLPGFSGAATGAPILGTKYVLSNMAMAVEKGIGAGKLPKVELDSFVYRALNSGQAERIYGDEGTQGPPPLSDFAVIQSGGVRATTGHPSKAPSAWN